MIAKAMLPTFGGAPQVWTASMVFFQAALLAGYRYAHLATQHIRLRRQAGAHIGLLILPIKALPVALKGTGLVGLAQTDADLAAAPPDAQEVSNRVVLARTPDDLGALEDDSDGRRWTSSTGRSSWTDDFSDILSGLHR